MTHDGNPTSLPTRAASSRLLSGIVVGVALGIAVAHLMLIVRGRSVDRDSTADEEFDRVVATSPGFAAVDAAIPHSVTHEAPALSILEFDGSEDVGRVRLSDQSSEQDHLHYFPEAMTAPGEGHFVSADRPGAGRSPMRGPLQMTADSSTARDTPPQALTPSPAAAPIDKATSDREAMALSIIRDEMPEATAQEREIWLEVLQGLPAEDIRGILRMRQHLGTSAAVELWPPLSLPTPQSDRAAEAVDSGGPLRAIAEESDIARRLRQITRYNLANRCTVAFKQQIPVLVEGDVEHPPGVRITRVVRDMRQGELEETGRTLDIAFEGPQFLQVRRGDDIRYTRDGRLTLDEQGRLKLLCPADEWLIDPPTPVPDDVIHLVISDRGELSAVLPDESETELGQLRIVRFLNPSALAAGQEGLYQETAASGAPHEFFSGPCVVQGYLERSNSTTLAAPACGSIDADLSRH
jgi:flagellar basal body rod protein FlgG